MKLFLSAPQFLQCGMGLPLVFQAEPMEMPIMRDFPKPWGQDSEQGRGLRGWPGWGRSDPTLTSSTSITSLMMGPSEMS